MCGASVLFFCIILWNMWVFPQVLSVYQFVAVFTFLLLVHTSLRYIPWFRRDLLTPPYPQKHITPRSKLWIRDQRMNLVTCMKSVLHEQRVVWILYDVSHTETSTTNINNPAVIFAIVLFVCLFPVVGGTVV